MNLFSLTEDYRYHTDSFDGFRFGAYVIGGGGWYYRHFTVSQNFIRIMQSNSNTPCQPIFFWWGFGCTTGGFVYSATVASGGNSGGGVNAGLGMTIKIGAKGGKFFTEARYTYAWSRGLARIPTTLVPVTLGIRFN
jgi:hypothetical protein